MERRLSSAVVRTGRPGDLDALERIETTVFDSDCLSRRSLRRFLVAPTTAVPVAEAADAVVGYAMIGFRRGSVVGRLFSLAVDKDHGRQGIGQALLAACEAAALERGCAAVRLEVRADNAGAVALYERAGYVRFGTYEDYYEDGAAALRFEKPLTATP